MYGNLLSIKIIFQQVITLPFPLSTKMKHSIKVKLSSITWTIEIRTKLLICEIES